MKRKILLGVSMLVVLLFLIQPVASIEMNSHEIDTNVDDSKILSDQEERTEDLSTKLTIPEESLMVTRQIPMKDYRTKMEENRDRALKADPNLYFPENDYDKMIITDDELKSTQSGPVLDNSNMDMATVNDYKPVMYRFGVKTTGGESKSRADGADLELTQMEWENTINSGWSSWTESETQPGNQPGLGGFMVGKTTRITVTVLNHDFPGKPVSGVYINFSIYDTFGFIPLIKIPTSVPFNINTATTTVHLDFTPQAAKILYIGAYISYSDDSDQSNNALAWSGMRVLNWFADFETGGTGGGSGADKTWTGDLGATNKWHTTSSAENQGSLSHTSPTSYHHGTEGGISGDSYSDSEGTDGYLYFTSPVIDFGTKISGGQEEAGQLPEGEAYFSTVVIWAGMFTGEAEEDGAFSTSDIMWYCNYTDNGGSDWKSEFSRYTRWGYMFGDWEVPFGGLQTNKLWNPNWWVIGSDGTTVYLDIGWPMRVWRGDGSGGYQAAGNGVQNWSKVQFRLEFDGDMGGDTGGLPGYYADDFFTWAYERWYPDYNIALTDVTTPMANDVPIFYPGMEFEFKTTVENMGEDLTNVPVKVIFYKGGTKTENKVDEKSQTITSIAKDAEVEQTWKWTPSAEGDYYIRIEAGDLTKDYTPNLNDDELKLYVRNPNARVLVVDDDNSQHSNGIYYKDVEHKMLNSLDQLGITYNVYTVGWNETGPGKTILNNYEAVIWMTGLDNEYDNYRRNPNFGTDWGITFKPEDQTQIGNWLNEGKKNFWVISPGALYDLTNTEGATSPTGFLKDYLHILYCNANETEYNSDGDVTKRGTPTVLIGETDTLGAGANYDTYDDKPEAQFDDYGSVIEGDSNSKTIFFQNTARTAFNSLQYSKNYKLVYFGFNYYLIEKADDRKDLTYRVMNFFGLVGGVSVDLDDDYQKSIGFGETVEFKFTVTNLGLMEETMNLKLVTPAPNNIPSGWDIKLNGKPVTATTNEITVEGNAGTEEIELKIKAPSEYLDNDGNMNQDYKNTSAGSEIQLKIRVESANYPDNFFDFAACKVVVDLVGYVKLTAEKVTDSIDISQDLEDEDHYVEYSIILRNVTNGDEDYTVLVTIDNPTEIVADVLQGGTVITDSEITLVPRMDQEVTVRVSADEHEPMDDYEITFKVMDITGTEELNSTKITTTVEQYYNIGLVESPSSSMTYSRLIDPNAMTADPQTEEFEVVIENYGNGVDTVTIEWTENRDSPSAIPLDWESSLVEIYDADGGSSEIDEVDVPAYDKTSGTPGEVTLLVKINIPKEEQEGRFWIDIEVTSSAPRSYVNNLQREDFEVEANWTFQIQMILPELAFDTDQSAILKADGTKYIDQVDKIVEDDKITLSIYVENSGSAPATDVDVEFSATLDNVPVSSYTETVTVEAGMSVNITWEFTTDDKGMYYFKVRIDPNNEILGDNQQDNTWNQYLSVKEKEKPPVDEPIGGFTTEEGGLSTTAVALIVIIIVIIVVVVIVFFLFIQKKKSEGEIEDITMVGAPMGMQPGMPPGAGMQPGMGMGMGMAPPGMMQQPGMAPPAGVTVGAAPEARALAPQAKKALPPASETGGATCPNCGEKNPPENKFCQGCGGKL